MGIQNLLNRFASLWGEIIVW